MLADFVIASADTPLINRWKSLGLSYERFLACSSTTELERISWRANSCCVLDLAVFQAGWAPIDWHVFSAKVCLCLFTDVFSTQEELHWLALGIRACCTPDLEDERLKVIVDVTSRGGIWVSNHTLPQLLQGLQRASLEGAHAAISKPHEPCLSVLTPQERKIALLVGQGESNKLIARALNISDHTVKTHLSAIFSKLHLSDRVHLALLVNQDPENRAH